MPFSFGRLIPDYYMLPSGIFHRSMTKYCQARNAYASFFLAVVPQRGEPGLEAGGRRGWGRGEFPLRQINRIIIEFIGSSR